MARIAGAPRGRLGVRCAHELDEQDIKRPVDQRVRVTGRPEYGPGEYGAGNDVRLLWVDEIEALT